MDSDSDISYDALENDITIDFEANQDNTNIHLHDFYNCKSPPTKPVMHYHLGKDLSGHGSSLGTILNKPSNGKRKLFVVGLSNILIDSEITNCVSLDIEGPITFFKSSQLF